MKFWKLSAFLVIFVSVIGLSLFTLRAQEGENAVYASIFWLGVSETECKVRASLIMDTPEECEVEHKRAEQEIADLVAKKNSRGTLWKWGIFEKCRQFTDTSNFNEVLASYEKQCRGSR